MASVSRAQAEGNKLPAMNPEMAKLQAVVDALLEGRGAIRVLEAGCGSSSYLRWGPNAHLVGIDISARQLERNDVISEKILGDIQSYDLPAASFDCIVCWDVLEHLPEPERALAGFARAVKGDGIIILAFPNPLSVKGLVTKCTPHWFHVWAYRHLFGFPDAGTDDSAPFRTYLRFSLAPGAIRRFAAQHGLSVAYLRLYEALRQRRLRERYRLTGVAWRLFKGLVRVVSLGWASADLSDCIVVLRGSRAPRGGTCTV